MTQQAVEELSTQTMLAQMQAQLAAQAAELRELRANRSAEGDGLVAAAVAEMEARIQPTGFTTTPCALCGRLFADHVSDTPGVRALVTDHTWRKDPVHSVPPQPGTYARAEQTKAVEPDNAIEDTYMSVAQTAKALKLKQAEVKSLIADGQLKADKILGTTVVRKVSVERLIALASVEAEDNEVIE